MQKIPMGSMSAAEVASLSAIADTLPCRSVLLQRIME